MTYQPPKNGMFSETLFLSVGDKYIDPGLRDRSASPTEKKTGTTRAGTLLVGAELWALLEPLGGSALGLCLLGRLLGPAPRSCFSCPLPSPTLSISWSHTAHFPKR